MSLYTFEYANDVFDFINTNRKQVFRSIVLVGHNPAYTEILNYFTENKILNLPTARWFCIKFDSRFMV
jgi:phosphohistidine phosphatase SixA